MFYKSDEQWHLKPFRNKEPGAPDIKLKRMLYFSY